MKGSIVPAVGKNGLPAGTRLVRIGSSDNVNIVDLCDDETGEIRTFMVDRLEEIAA